MGLDKLIKREIGITIAVVLLVTTVFIMFSYAIFKVEVSGETNAITFGDIELAFCANPEDPNCDNTIPYMGNVIGTKTENGVTRYVPVYPQEDPTTSEEWAQLTPYAFYLENKGTLDLYVSIILTRVEDSELQYTVDDVVYSEPVPDDQIKIALGEAGVNPTIMEYGDIEGKASETPGVNGVDKTIAKNILIPAGQKKVFNLYAYLRSDAANESQGKYFVTQISARGEYLPEAPTD